SPQNRVAPSAVPDHVAIEPQPPMPPLLIQGRGDGLHRENPDGVAPDKFLSNGNGLDTLSRSGLPARMARASSQPLGSIEQPRQYGDTKRDDSHVACNQRPKVLPDIPLRHRSRCRGELGVLASVRASACSTLAPRRGNSGAPSVSCEAILGSGRQPGF